MAFIFLPPKWGKTVNLTMAEFFLKIIPIHDKDDAYHLEDFDERLDHISEEMVLRKPFREFALFKDTKFKAANCGRTPTVYVSFKDLEDSTGLKDFKEVCQEFGIYYHRFLFLNRFYKIIFNGACRTF